MKDLDFDELDRAVSSLIGGATPASPSATTQPAEKVINIEPTLPDTAPLTPPVVESSSSTTLGQQRPTEERTPVKAFAAKRSSGRFMDVVHPSSDMKSTSTSSSRQGVTITPSPGFVAPPAPVVKESPVVVAPSSESAPVATPQPQEEETKPTLAANAWPDPLDFHGFSASEEDKAPTSDVVHPLDSVKPPVEPSVLTEVTPTAAATDEPLDSPFLAGAQVEKRPLGAFSAEHTSEDASVVPVDDVTTQQPIETDLPQEPITATGAGGIAYNPEPEERIEETAFHEKDAQLPADSTELPEELQDNLLSIESDVVTPEASVQDVAPAAQRVAPSPDVADTPIVGSIPQQYKESPAKEVAAETSIYDTEPLKHPAKKKSGWLIVLWIVLLLVVGAGVGAAMYFFVLPLL